MERDFVMMVVDDENKGVYKHSVICFFSIFTYEMEKKKNYYLDKKYIKMKQPIMNEWLSKWRFKFFLFRRLEFGVPGNF